MKTIRIGGASGYWGDTNRAPAQLAEKGEVDYLVFDYLAEVTMAILAKQKSRKPDQGFAHDFVHMVMKPLIKTLVEKKIKVIANAGGVNLSACRRALEAVADQAGVLLKIGVVEGDDLMANIETLRAKNPKEFESGAIMPPSLLSANAYLGAFPIAAALDAGANVVLTGRCVDSATTLAALIHEFRWRPEDFDLLAQGSLCGHILECGAQATGGNFTDWRDVEAGWEDVGYPIAECQPDGVFVITKPPGTGGAVTPFTTAEQMLYEIGDPAAYILPDVVCDFRDVQMVSEGKDRVKIFGARGLPPTSTYKATATYLDGFSCVTTSLIAGFDAAQKARRVGEANVNRCSRLLSQGGMQPFAATQIDVIGDECLYGANGDPARPAPREVVLRVAVAHERFEGADLFAHETVGSALAMTTGRCSVGGGGRPSVSPMVKLFSFLIDKSDAPIQVFVGDEKIDFSPASSRGEPPSAPTDRGSPETEPLFNGPTIHAPLIALALARSGDKGDSANIGVIARKPEYLAYIRAGLTRERVRDFFAHLAEGEVERFELPGVHALNFVLRNSLGGGGASSIRLDSQGKTYAQLLLALPIEIPQEFAGELGRSASGFNPIGPYS